MNEPELFLVTVIFGNGVFNVDMELPSQLPVKDLSRRVLEILKSLYEGEFSGWNSCDFEFNNKILSDDDTLLATQFIALLQGGSSIDYQTSLNIPDLSAQTFHCDGSLEIDGKTITCTGVHGVF